MITREIEQAIAKVLEGFDVGVFVRDTRRDHESGWAVRALPYLAALGTLADLSSRPTTEQHVTLMRPAASEPTS